MTDLAPSRTFFFLICKAKSPKTENIDEIIFYLKSKYSEYNEESKTLINNIPREEPSFEAITDYLKTFSESIKKDENMSLKNKCLFGGCILMASKVYRKKLPHSFEDWLYSLCKIKGKVSYNYRNLFKLVSIAPKLINSRVNTTYFVKNHEILLNYFNELATQKPGNHMSSCTCEDCISYLREPASV